MWVTYEESNPFWFDLGLALLGQVSFLAFGLLDSNMRQSERDSIAPGQESGWVQPETQQAERLLRELQKLPSFLRKHDRPEYLRATNSNALFRISTQLAETLSLTPASFNPYHLHVADSNSLEREVTTPPTVNSVRRRRLDPVEEYSVRD
ncbi:MAG: uncharacterized protein KVP18_000844 [Porospora cf. gigantea A]|uniref:uncharacterized protein n=1 Tax=Porospora cf. gigantea A TaxID=2853593 RepID=UPI003559D042|nr:MAG: hypothetical protein KVP18_000844 [Porospora cf. gigantea A]